MLTRSAKTHNSRAQECETDPTSQPAHDCRVGHGPGRCQAQRDALESNQSGRAKASSCGEYERCERWHFVADPLPVGTAFHLLMSAIHGGSRRGGSVCACAWVKHPDINPFLSRMHLSFVLPRKSGDVLRASAQVSVVFATLGEFLVNWRWAETWVWVWVFAKGTGEPSLLYVVIIWHQQWSLEPDVSRLSERSLGAVWSTDVLELDDDGQQRPVTRARPDPTGQTFTLHERRASGYSHEAGEVHQGQCWDAPCGRRGPPVKIDRRRDPQVSKCER